MHTKPGWVPKKAVSSESAVGRKKASTAENNGKNIDQKA